MSGNKRVLTLFFLFCSAVLLPAQHAPGVDWKKIETDHFTIIFPGEIQEQAEDLASRIETIYSRDAESFGEIRSSRWPLILTTSGMVANGYVSLAPAKSVWYGTPIGENLSTLDWYDLLGLHETRHMVQYDRMNERTIRFMYYIGGEMARSAGLFLAVPDWFLEGDAVAAETAFSDSGRGRDPVFYQQMRAIVLNEDYSYQKMVNRSYRDSIPNHYEFGYFLSSYIKKHYGADSWDRILDSAALVPVPALGIYIGAKKVTGKSWTELYRDMTGELKVLWEQQRDRIRFIENTPLTASPDRGHVRWDPVAVTDEGVLARKTSLSQPARLVRVTDTGEEPLFRVPSSGRITSNGRTAVWSFIRPSTLHEAVSWSDLVRKDLETGQKTYLSVKKRYLYPAYSHGGEEIAVVEWTDSRRGVLVILNEATGEVLERYEIPPGLFPAYPAWSEDDRTLYFTVQGKEGRALAGLGRDSGGLEYLTPFSAETVKRPVVWGDTLLYSSNLSGLENIMALDLQSGDISQVTSRPGGVRNPVAAGGAEEGFLIYSDYMSSRGEQLARQDLNPEEWIPLEKVYPQPFLYYGGEDHLEGGEGWTIRTPVQDPPEEAGIVEDYSLTEGLFNIHSWGFSPNLETLTGLTVHITSQNVHDTLNWTLGGEFDLNEQAWGAFFNMSVKQFYPVIGWNSRYRYRDVNYRDTHDISSVFRMSFPLNLSRDLWTLQAVPYAGGGVQSLIPADSSSDAQFLSPLHYGFNWSALLPGSLKSLNPQWGISQVLYFNHTPMQNMRYLFSGNSTVYLPGLFRNNSLILSGGYERQTGEYSSRILFPRGYAAVKGEELIKGSADYDFPLAYPDGGLGSLFYIKRIRGRLFYDIAAVNGELYNGNDNLYQSAGIEVNLDMTALNFKNGEFNLGFRFSWLIEEKKPSVQMVFMNAAFF